MKTMIIMMSLALSLSLRAQTCTIQMTPQNQVVTCNLASIQHVTISVSPANVLHTIVSPLGGVTTMTGNPVVYHPIGTGTYSYTLMDVITGCTNTAQFTVGSMTTFPTFSLSSGQDFMLGCSPKDVDIVSISNVSVTGMASYTMLAPGASTSLPAGPLGIQTSYNIGTVGIWTVVVRQSNGCQTRMPFSVGMNTVAPAIGLASHLSTLTCANPTTALTSTSSGVSFTTMNISAPGAYSFVVTNTTNACTSSTVITISQNIVTPTVSLNSSYNVDCTSGVATIAPNSPNMSYNWSWSTGVTTPVMTTSVAGQHSVQVTNPTNGCVTSASVTVIACDVTGIGEYAPSLNSRILYYDLTGNQIEKPVIGFYIEVTISGNQARSRKVLIQ